MKTKRILGAVCATLLASSLGAIAACGGTSDAKEVSTEKAVNTASVSIALMDANGNRVGAGSGVLIAPRLVLTAGHLISGNAKWVVTSADGKSKVTGSRGLTYDWLRYDSNKAHPRKNDVGIIYLDDAIKLDAYPKLSGVRAADGAQATRIRGTGAGFEAKPIELLRNSDTPHAYLAANNASESLDTGGAVFDGGGIVGLVSGRGITSGKLYIARLDNLAAWLAPKIACAGGSASVRTFAAPAPKAAVCDDAGAPSSSSGGNPGSTPGAGGPGSPGGGDNGDSGGSGACSDDHDGRCSGSGCGSNTGGNDTSSNPGSSSGNPGSTSGNPGSTSGDNPGSTSGNPGSTSGNPGSTSGDNPGTDNGSSGASTPPGSSSGSDGNQNGGPKGNNGVGNGIDGQPPGNPPINDGPGTGPGNPGNKGGSSGAVAGQPDHGKDDHGKDVDRCEGPSDNPETCPPEADGCSGSACGGGDEDIDFGFCGCGAHGEGKDIVVK